MPQEVQVNFTTYDLIVLANALGWSVAMDYKNRFYIMYRKEHNNVPLSYYAPSLRDAYDQVVAMALAKMVSMENNQ